MVSVAALDAHARLVRCDHRGPAQGGHGGRATGAEAPLGALKQVHQPALAEGETEQVRQGRLQPLVGQRLEGLQIRRHRMQPRAERRAARRLRHRRDHPRLAGRAVHGQPSMLRHDRRHLRQLDPLGHAHDLGGKIAVQGAAAA